jgi:hypothetical protein
MKKRGITLTSNTSDQRNKRTRKAPLGDVTNIPCVRGSLKRETLPLKPTSPNHEDGTTQSSQLLYPQLKNEQEEEQQQEEKEEEVPLSMNPLSEIIQQIATVPAQAPPAASTLTFNDPVHPTSPLHLIEQKYQLSSETLSPFISSFSYGRRRLLNTLMRVLTVYSLQIQTLFVAMNILDRYLSHFPHPSEHFSPGHLKLIGVSSLFIAAKFIERRFSFSIHRFTRACRAYRHDPDDEILLPETTTTHAVSSSSSDSNSGVVSGNVENGNNVMTPPIRNPLIIIELDICQTLQFFVDPPTVLTFLFSYLPLMRNTHHHISQTETETAIVTMSIQVLYYLAERILADSAFLFFLPSLIAATLVRLVRRSFDPERGRLGRAEEGARDGVWPGEYITHSGYHEDDLEECERTLKSSLLNQPMDFELERKYQQSPHITTYPLVFGAPTHTTLLGPDSHGEDEKRGEENV